MATVLYELWDVRSGNIINTYDTEDEALRVVRNLLTLNGLEYGSVLSLSFEDDDENTSLIAKGPALIQRVNLIQRLAATLMASAPPGGDPDSAINLQEERCRRYLTCSRRATRARNSQQRLAANSEVIWPGPSYCGSTSTTSKPT
jgi:hypothetical protein